MENIEFACSPEELSCSGNSGRLTVLGDRCSFYGVPGNLETARKGPCLERRCQHGRYGGTYALRLKYAKKSSEVVGVGVKLRRNINSTRNVRAIRMAKQEQNIHRKRGDTAPHEDMFVLEPRPDGILPWM